MTGCAGFIGFSLSRQLVQAGTFVIGVDNLNDTCAPALKQARLERLRESPRFTFFHLDLRDGAQLRELFTSSAPDIVVHLAAHAGVRRSQDDPVDYVENNVVGFAHLLEACRAAGPRHLVYASSSSVYGDDSPLPFSPRDPADHPVSTYAATKRTNELQAHVYSSLYGLPTTGLRFFSVYGPWGRPDMAYFSFADAILAGRPLTVYGDGTALRDFTFVDDVVEGIVAVAGTPPKPDEAVATSGAPWRVLNIGHGEQASVGRLLELLEGLLGRRAIRRWGPPQPGDVRVTHADTQDLRRVVGLVPQVPLEDGLARFVDWLRWYRS